MAPLPCVIGLGEEALTDNYEMARVLLYPRA
jgi:hypothetical protein